MTKHSSGHSVKGGKSIPASVRQAAERGMAGQKSKQRSAARAKKAEMTGRRTAAQRGNGVREQGEKSVFRSVDVFIVALLLVLPVAALWPLLKGDARLWAAGITVVLSLFAFCAVRRDKLCARNGAWRTPEATLHLFELLGGWPGSYLAQRIYRHKISKTRYQIVFWLIVALYQAAAIDYMRGWQWAKAIGNALGI